MSRDKLITIRIEESKRNAFRKWAKNNKIDGATFLYKVIKQCIENKLSTDIINPNIASQQSIADIQTSIQKLYKKFQERSIEQDSKTATLQAQIDDLTIKLSSQSISKLNTQKVSKQIDTSKEDLLSDRQLAEILGVAPTTVNRWRTGQRKPSNKHQNLFDHYKVIENKWRKI